MNHLDLFSGIGGFSLASQNICGEDHNILAFVEIDEFCQKVLKKHWPDVPIFDDIKGFKKGDTNGKIDLLTGGFPCQPFSIAGRRKGKTDDRYLWPEMFRVIRETKPTWIVGENVPGILNMGLETTVLDLEKEGYEVELFVLPACSVGAWHKRDRVWIVAHFENVANSDNTGNGTSEHETNGDRQTIHERWKRQSQFESGRQSWNDSADICETISNSSNERLQGSEQCGNNEEETSRGKTSTAGSITECGSDAGRYWEFEPNVGRVAHGVPNRVDRLKSLGNSIVPQIAEIIFLGIREVGDLK